MQTCIAQMEAPRHRSLVCPGLDDADAIVAAGDVATTFGITRVIAAADHMAAGFRAIGSPLPARIGQNCRCQAVIGRRIGWHDATTGI
jgi:hypothetical protein